MGLNESVMSQQPVKARTQAVDFGPAIFVLGFMVSFFAFNALGRDIASEAEKGLREQIKRGGIRVPRLGRGEAAPRPREAAEPMELSDESALVLGLNSITKKVKDSGCIASDVLKGFNLQYAMRGEELLKDINKDCLQTKLRSGDTPMKPGDVGFMVRSGADYSDSTFRIVSFGWPARGKELELPLKNWADWLANPHMLPVYSKVR